MNIQREFAKFLRKERNLIACDEVSFYGCIADVLAIDQSKELIIEYEFKKTSYDLKTLERKKSKYQLEKTWYKGSWRLANKLGVSHATVWLEPQRPHKFYYVVPTELFEKENQYFNSQHSEGVITYHKEDSGEIRFVTVKNCRMRKSNLQKYNLAIKAISARLANIYAYENL